MIQKLSIIIPVFNESETIISVLEKVSDVQLINNIAKQIIIVDDHSSDNSLEAITQFKNNIHKLILQLLNSRSIWEKVMLCGQV